MKRIYCIIIALLGMGAAAKAQTDVQTIVDDISVSDLKMERNGAYMEVGLKLWLEKLAVHYNKAVLLTPKLVNGSDSLELPSVGIYGRKRYYYYLRNGGSMLTDKNETSYMASEKPGDMDYHSLVSWADWMNGADLVLSRSDYGCCSTLLDSQEGMLGHHVEAFFPKLVFMRPKADTMIVATLKGKAFIDFPVDKTVIYPEYRRNMIELGRIRSTIDSVKNVAGVTIEKVWLKGYASPESPYRHNRDLAYGRTEALKNYIQQFYRFGEGVIATDYEPEDWEGLRLYVSESGLEHRQEILDIIDTDMDLDDKEWKIKRTYPKEYKFLLQECYPALRHTDYSITYKVETLYDANEILRMMHETPQKLTLNEFYIVSQLFEPDSDEFAEVFDISVRMFPNDVTANLNAANAAIRRDDFVSAERYLAKSGDSAEAIYARGALAVRKKDYDTARRYLYEAKALGLEQAAMTLSELDQGRR